MENKTVKHKGRIGQTFLYLGKLFRMFIFQNDWKVLPMSAVIAGLISFAVGTGMFKNMESTLMGTFALSCVCVWNGFFNSIQVICRERAILKREHRAGLHISSYLLAHMIYQAVLCMLQSIITMVVCTLMGITLPSSALITPWPLVDFGITLFLTTYCADMLAILVSSFSKTTTAAMTIMPFLLIVELIFSGPVFKLPQRAEFLTNITATKWSVTAMCSQGDYNSLPMITLWNTAVGMKELEIGGEKPLYEMLVFMEQNDMRDDFLIACAEQNQKPEYNFDSKIMLDSWGWLAIWTFLYVLAALIVLEFIDKDKR